jgi:hypothetical protein
VTVPLSTSIAHLLPWMMRPDGKFTSYLGRVSSSRRDPPSGVKPTDSIPVPFVLYDATGSVTDTIGWAGRPPPRLWRPPSEDNTEFRTIQVGDRRQLVPSPPSGLPWWMPLSDGYLLIETPLAETQGDGVLTVTPSGPLIQMSTTCRGSCALRFCQVDGHCTDRRRGMGPMRRLRVTASRPFRRLERC